MFDITALGEILIDFTPVKTDSGKRTFEQNPGGAPANLLATVAKFGGKAAFIGKVGNDMFGTFLKEVLTENGIDCTGLVIDDIHNTTLAFVALDESGDRSFSFYRNFGADIFLTKKDVPENVIKSSKIFHFGSLSLTNEPAKTATDYALDIAKKSGCIITLDPNYRPLLWKSSEEAVKTIREYVPLADIIKFSKEEIQMVTGKDDVKEAIKAVTDIGVALVLVTDGGNGVSFGSKGFDGFVPSLKVETVDTTGAGDIFFGTFLYEFIKSGKKPCDVTTSDMMDFVTKAVKISGLSTLKKGAIPSIPEYDEKEILS